MIIRRRRVRLQIEQTTLHAAFVQTCAATPAAPPVVAASISRADSADHSEANLPPASQEPRK